VRSGPLAGIAKASSASPCDLVHRVDIAKPSAPNFHLKSNRSAMLADWRGAFVGGGAGPYAGTDQPGYRNAV